MPIARLADRGVIKVSGGDAEKFLQNLVTCDLDHIPPEGARWGALLTPQGKIISDFMVVRLGVDDGGGFLLDAPAALAGDLARKLGFYKLRAAVAVEDASADLAVVAGWDGAARPGADAALAFDDPRLDGLGWRGIVPAAEADGMADASADGWHAHRISLGVPEGGRDWVFGDTFPHEAGMDQLAGVDFDKGCFVGQEVVSRMQHRGTARTRAVPVVFTDGIVAEGGAEVTAGERSLGRMGSGAAGRGIAMIRLDRAADALAAGERILAGNLPVTLEKPRWARFAFPGEAA